MDYNADKAKLTAQRLAAQLQAQRNADRPPLSNKFWKPNLEKRTVRILPVRVGDDGPIYSFWTHYKFAGKNIHCPESNEGNPCAICDFVRELSKEGKTVEAKAMKVSLSFHAVVSERFPDGSVGAPGIWTFSSLTRYNTFAEYLTDPEYNKYFDVGPEGWDFRVFHTPRAVTPPKPGQRPMPGGGVELHVLPLKQRPLSNDPAVTSRVMEEALAIDKFLIETLHKPIPSSEIETLFNEWAAGGATQSSGQEDTALQDVLAAAIKATK